MFSRTFTVSTILLFVMITAAGAAPRSDALSAKPQCDGTLMCCRIVSDYRNSPARSLAKQFGVVLDPADGGLAGIGCTPLPETDRCPGYGRKLAYCTGETYADILTLDCIKEHKC